MRRDIDSTVRWFFVWSGEMPRATGLNDLATGESAMQREAMTDWAVHRAQEIVMREGFDLIKSARSLDQNAIRTNGVLLAKAIAASLVEASATER